MRKSIFHSAFAAACLIGTSASAADFVLNILPQAEQKSRFDDGREVIDDTAKTSTARIFEPRDKTPKQSGFRVLVANEGDKPFNFGPEDVSIRLPDGSVVVMISYQELVKKQERAEMWQGLAVGLAAAGREIQASQAGTTYGTATTYGNTYGNVGATPFAARSSATTTYTGYNAGAAALARSAADSQNRRDAQQLALNQAAQREELAQVMKKTTVDPGQVFGGVVRYDVPKSVQSATLPVPITIRIRAGDEVHEFEAILGKYRR